MNSHFTPSQAAKKGTPTLNVWESLGFDKYLRPDVAEKRKASGKLLQDNYENLIPYINRCEFPFYLKPSIQKLGINSMLVKDHGGPGFTNLEQGAVIFEIAKHDASVGTFILVHNAIGTACISELGDEEQRARLLKDSLNMNKVCSFGLSEPTHGSDATSLLTTATKTKGGWLLNGKKRWIGNATFADYIVTWAKNASDGNKI